MLISTSTILIKYINWFQRHKRIWNLSTGKLPSVLYPNLLHQGEFVSTCTALSAGWHMNHHPDPNTHPSPLEPVLAGQSLSLSPLWWARAHWFREIWVWRTTNPDQNWCGFELTFQILAISAVTLQSYTWNLKLRLERQLHRIFKKPNKPKYNLHSLFMKRFHTNFISKRPFSPHFRQKKPEAKQKNQIAKTPQTSKKVLYSVQRISTHSIGVLTVFAWIHTQV